MRHEGLFSLSDPHLHLALDQPREVGEIGEVGFAPIMGLRVERTEGAERLALYDERYPAVRPDPVIHDDRVAAQALIRPDITEDEGLPGDHDSLAATIGERAAVIALADAG